MSRLGRVTVELRNIGGSRGPGEVRALIKDPKFLGLSGFANGAGELFFTLPHGHAAIGEIQPLLRHYRVFRHNPRTDTEDIIGVGLLENYVAGPDEIIAYGTDYMGLLSTTISTSVTSYTSATLGSIVTSSLSEAINEGNSRLAFASMGTIEATSRTTTVLTRFQPRLEFLASIAEISMSDRSVRTILSVTRSAPYTFSFIENKGVDRPDIRLAFGDAYNNFRYTPGFDNFATRIFGIGVKREGATILYSTQTYGDESTYGRISRPVLHQDIVNQAALDDKVKRNARLAGTPEKRLQFPIRANFFGPYEGYEFGDSIRGIVSRGRVEVDGLYTIWGHEFTLNPDGGQSLSLIVEPKGL